MAEDNREIVVLDGGSLSIDDIVAVGVGDKRVELSPVALERCRSSRSFLSEEIGKGRIIYGVNTSFGPMCGKIIRGDEIKQLQLNLIRSHAAGLGDPLKPYIALAVLTVRLNSLVKGFSGVRIELLERLREMINLGVAPYIPECGSVGASGDLVHLAHMALAIVGEGDAYRRTPDHSWVRGEAADILRSVGLEPLELEFKDGIALMNGTSAMTALGAFAVFGARKLLNLACVHAAFAMEIFGGIDDAFDEDLHSLKPHPGQTRIAEIVRRLYEGSGNITRREDVHARISSQRDDNGPVFETEVNVQDVYSIRCAPQILAPAAEAIEKASEVLFIEANSSNDNPIVVPERKKIIHGGNFHGQSVAFAMDSLCMAVAEICNISERRINKLLDKKLNEGLPEQLVPGTPGLEMGFMGAQYLATSTTAENRHMANPVGTLSISCNASNQDVVSMGTIAARKAFKSISNAKHVLTLETLADLQALHFRNADKLGVGTRRLHEALSGNFKPYDDRRVFHGDLTEMRKLLFSSQLLDDLDAYIKD